MVESAIVVPGAVAVIVVEPVASVLARPWLPLALPITATVLVDESQVTSAVRSCVVLSLNTPVAVNCSS